MKKEQEFLKPEDYLEPRCLLCGEPYGAEPGARSVPQRRIIEKMDEYMSRRDYDGAERHLLYWLQEAKLLKDLRGELLLRNELTGHYRKTGAREKSLENAREALKLLEVLEFEGTISSGTAYTNAATAFSAFGEQEEAKGLFEKALSAYESAESTSPELLGGLYNNMALCLVSLKEFEQARVYYQKALDTMAKVKGGELEQAITCLNLANAEEAQYGLLDGEPEIFRLLDRAEALLDSTAAPRDGYYAFVCEKCAPTFSYYGYFRTAEELKRRAEEIYERP